MNKKMSDKNDKYDQKREDHYWRSFNHNKMNEKCR